MAEYDFSALSPKDFELLVRDLLAAEYGWPLEVFGHGRDGGVDLRLEQVDKKILVQCKHYAGSSFSQLKSALVSELTNVDAQAPDRYLVATSRRLSKTQKDTLVTLLHPWLLPGDLLHQLDVNRLIEKHPDVERLHFKLWLASASVLSSIVRSGIWARSEALLEDIQDRVRLYVTNPSYERAAALLAKNHVAVIAGSPGVGKSLLAEMLVLTHWKQGWQIIHVGSNIQDAWNGWRPSGKQIFLYDDFLGQTDLAEGLMKNEDTSIVRFSDLVGRCNDKRLILTTRTQVLRQAEERHEPLRRGSLDLRTCGVDLSDYSLITRAMILYNHLYFSQLPRQVVREYTLQERYWTTITHPNYNPRIVEQVVKQPITSTADLYDALRRALEDPAELWRASFEVGLSDIARQLLIMISSFPPAGAPISGVAEGLGVQSTSRMMMQALKALEGTWITLEASENLFESDSGLVTISFANPSCRDYVLSYIDKYPDELARLVSLATSLGQIELLLQYARSRTSPGRIAEYRYSGMRNSFLAHKKETRSKVEELFNAAILDRQVSLCVHLESLANLLVCRELLWAGFDGWLMKGIRKASKISLAKGQGRGCIAALAALYEFLSETIVDLDEDSAMHKVASEVSRWIISCLVGALEDESDYRTILPILDTLLEDDGLTTELSIELDSRFVKYIRMELLGLATAFDTELAMTERIRDLRDLVLEFDPDLDLDLEDDFSVAETKVREFGRNRNKPAEEGPIGAESAFSRDSSMNERGRPTGAGTSGFVRALFGPLA